MDSNRLRADQREAAIEWVSSLGVKPADVRPTFVIRQAEQGYELHLSRYRRNSNGHLILDVALNEAVSEPLIVRLGADATWPDFSTGVVDLDGFGDIGELVHALRQRLRVISDGRL